MAIYKAILKGHVGSTLIANDLYYRTGIGFNLGGLTLGGSGELANCLATNLWQKMMAVSSEGYTLDEITVYPYDDTTFDLLYQQPYTLQVGENGSVSGTLLAPEQCMILRFTLEPTLIISNGPKPPKKGYIAFGPVNAGYSDGTGHVAASVFSGANAQVWSDFLEQLAADQINVLPPVDFFPIRVHQDRVPLIGLKITSFADVQACSIRHLMSWRRSRQAEV